MQKLILFIMGLVCTGMIWGHAQSPPEIRPLHIGDTVPDITLNHIINYKTTSAKLSDFRGKLLILDFWATWCGACIGSFPRTHRLQVEFNNQVQFLPVAYESPETSRKMLDRIQKNEGTTIPSVTSDTILIKLFPHRVLPHYVWIGKSGHVIAITGLEDLTYSNISKFLSDQAPVLPVKTDYQIPFNRNRPLFLDGNGGNGSQTVYRSVISRYVPGIDGCSGSGIKSMNSIHGRRIYAVNTTIVNLYRMALGKSYTKFLPRSRVILDVKDTDRVITGLSGRKYIEWLQRNGYCYELQVPPALMHKAFDIMAQELNRYFKAMLGISARMEKRTVPCYVLIRTTKDNKVLTKGGKSIHQVSAYNLKIQNAPFAWYRAYMNMFIGVHFDKPFLDETNLGKDSVDLAINAKLTDIKATNKQLEKYGLKIITADRTLDMIVISDHGFKEKKQEIE